MEIVELMDIAKGKNGLKSDRALARAIGMASPTLIRIRQGWGFPSEQNMMKLGDLAGIDKASALLFLNMWKAEGEAKQTYFEILSKIAPTVALCFIISISFMASTPAYATISPAPMLHECKDTVYYGNKRRLFRKRVLRWIGWH
jgi:hypothetical protein